jgi:hypothetical protein
VRNNHPQLRQSIPQRGGCANEQLIYVFTLIE